MKSTSHIASDKTLKGETGNESIQASLDYRWLEAMYMFHRNVVLNYTVIPILQLVCHARNR